MTEEDRLAEVFTELADTLVGDFDVVEFLDVLARRCVELLEVAAAGIMLADAGRLRVTGASSEDARLLDLFDLLSSSAPCVDCLSTRAPLLGTDLGELAGRDPALADHLPGTGFATMDALPMRLRDEAIGVTVLLRPGNGPVAPNHRALARALADVATIGLIQQRTIHESRRLAGQLQVALDSRVLLEQAKGVLAERAGLDVAQAFDLMRSYARTRRRLLADVARDVLAGALGIADLSGT